MLDIVTSKGIFMTIAKDHALDIEQEIEYPRYYDVMTLSSNFDSIGYVCHECDFLLVMK
jgi:hypothetical protein